MTDETDTELVHVPNNLAIGLENIDKTGGIDVPRDILNEIQAWTISVEFDEDDMTDIHRVKEFGEYVADREHFRGSDDHVTVSDEDRIAAVRLSTFLEF